MKRRLFFLTRSDRIVDLAFVGMWVALAVGDARQGDWLTGVVHLLTAVFVVLFVMRLQLSRWRARMREREAIKTVEMLVVIAQTQGIDPAQARQHLAN